MVELAALGVLGIGMFLAPWRSWGSRWRAWGGAAPIAAASVVAAMFVFVPTRGAVVAIAAFGAAGVSWLARRRRRRGLARLASLAVQAVCGELADDLRVGRVPEDALVAAGVRWPPMRPAVVAAQLHHDVEQALREIARLPGAEGLRDLAAAWHVSGRVGGGLAAAVEQVARLLAARERRARLVDAELAAARATAMVVSGLPLLVLAMGSGLGTHPWAFFLDGLGAVALGLGVLLLLSGWVWLDWLSARAAAA